MDEEFDPFAYSNEGTVVDTFDPAEYAKGETPQALPTVTPKKQTFYYPETPEATRAAGLSYSMEGGIHGSGKFSDMDLRNHTMEKYDAGESPFVAAAMAGVPTGTEFNMVTEGKKRLYKQVDTGGGLVPGQVDIATSNPDLARGGGTFNPREYAGVPDIHAFMEPTPTDTPEEQKTQPQGNVGTAIGKGLKDLGKAIAQPRPALHFQPNEFRQPFQIPQAPPLPFTMIPQAESPAAPAPAATSMAGPAPIPMPFPQPLPTPYGAAPVGNVAGGLADALKSVVLPFGTTEDLNQQYPQPGMSSALMRMFPEQIQALQQNVADIQTDPTSRKAVKAYGQLAMAVGPFAARGISEAVGMPKGVSEQAVVTSTREIPVPEAFQPKATNPMDVEVRLRQKALRENVPTKPVEGLHELANSRGYTPAVKSTVGRIFKGDTHDSAIENMQKAGGSSTLAPNGRGYISPDGKYMTLMEVARNEGAASAREIPVPEAFHPKGNIAGGPPSSGLVPAFLDKSSGQVFYGNPGRGHISMVDELPKGKSLQSGFAGPDGKFLNAEEAHQFALNEGVSAARKEDGKRKLDALSYSEQKYPSTPRGFSRAEAARFQPKALTQSDLPQYAQGALQAANRSDRPGISNSTWIQQSVPISSLKLGNEMIFNKGSFIPRKSQSKGPILVASDGEIIDGNNRVYEALQRGDKTIEVYREAPPQPPPVPPKAPSVPPASGGIPPQPPHNAPEMLRNRQIVDRITSRFDSVYTRGDYDARQKVNELRQDFGARLTEGDKTTGNVQANKDMEAATFIAEAQQNKIALKHDLKLVQESKNKKLAAKYEPILQYALDNFDRISRIPNRYHKLMTDQLAEDAASGITYGERQGYVTHVLKNEPAKTLLSFFTDRMGSGGLTRYFTKNREFGTLAEAIHEGVEPASVNLADLAQHRISASRRLILQKAMWNELRDIQAPDGRVVLASPGGETPFGYDQVVANGVHLNVHPDYSGIFKSLYGDSAMRRGPVGRGVMRTAGVLKAYTLAADTFHGFRGIMKGLFYGKGKGRIGFQKGTTVYELSDGALDTAVKNGELTQSQADYAKGARPAVEEMMSNGLNVSRYSDNLVGQMHVQFPGTRGLNNWIFQRVFRGAMLQASHANYMRNLKRWPELTKQEVARKTAKEMNEVFGNLMNQGLIRDKTVRDALNVAVLAPQWVESQVRAEFRGYGQWGTMAKDAVTKGKFRLGTVAQGQATAVAAYLVGNQIINYATTGHSTFGNKEHKLSAFLPIGDRGVYLNPLALSAEYVDRFMDIFERQGEHASVASVLSQMGRSKLSRAGQATVTLATQRDWRGRTLEGSDLYKEVGITALPIPIGATSVGGSLIELDPNAPMGFTFAPKADKITQGVLQAMGQRGILGTPEAQYPRAPLRVLRTRRTRQQQGVY